jgi:hypothetical protein
MKKTKMSLLTWLCHSQRSKVKSNLFLLLKRSYVLETKVIQAKGV